MISKVRAFGLGVGATALVLFAACGSNVVGATGSGAAGGGGAGGDGCSDPEECSGGATTTGPGGFGGTGPGGSGFSSSTAGPSDGGSGPTGVGGAGGGGQACGGFPGSTCPPNAYCAYPDHECGGNDGAGVCTEQPQGCGKDYEPTCGCDHMVYGNPCLANQAGVDVDDLGGCTAPAGMFGCGSGFCDLTSQYCLQVPSGVSAGLGTYTCEPLPAACGSSPSCACLSQVMCGPICQGTPDGGLDVTCETN